MQVERIPVSNLVCTRCDEHVDTFCQTLLIVGATPPRAMQSSCFNPVVLTQPVMTLSISAASSAASSSSAPLISRQKRLVMGNWKMNGSLASNADLLSQLKQGLAALGEGVDVAVCVPFPYLAQASHALAGTRLTWGAQDVSAREMGAFTGEVAASMLSDFSCRWVLAGHSERRTLHGETDEIVAQKAQAALSRGITPVVCVGESLEQRDAGQVRQVIERQLRPVLQLGADTVARMVIAYEPVWAIGTGRSATADQAQDVHGFIRQLLDDASKDIPLLYGGSVKPDNAAVLFGMPDIDGALVGGAALVSKDFMAIATQGASSR